MASYNVGQPYNISGQILNNGPAQSNQIGSPAQVILIAESQENDYAFNGASNCNSAENVACVGIREGIWAGHAGFTNYLSDSRASSARQFSLTRQDSLPPANVQFWRFVATFLAAPSIVMWISLASL